MTTIDSDQIATSASVSDYFAAALAAAADHQGVHLNPATSRYVTNLLTQYSHVRALRAVSDAGRHHRALADLYAEALRAGQLHQRCLILQRLGDLALFIAGLFAESLQRKLVDVDYYVDMGGAAYGYLHGAMRPSAEASAGFSAFEELEQKFCQVVDLLAEIAENRGLQSNSDLLRHYDAWLSSGSERARRRLIRAGIVPISGRALSTSH